MRQCDGDSRRRGDRAADERGAGMAEFALILPLIIIIMFSIFEFGLAFNRAQAVEAAAREGARLASISSTTPADVVTRVNDSVAGIPLENPLNVSIPTGVCAGREGQEVRVEVTTDHNVYIPLVVDQDVTLEGEAVFRCEA